MPLRADSRTHHSLFSYCFVQCQDPNRCVVECRRISGSCLAFQDAYRRLSAALCDLVCDARSDDDAADRESGEELLSDEAMMI